MSENNNLISYDGDLFVKCSEETQYVYSEKMGGFGIVKGKCGRDNIGIHVDFQNGIWREIDFAYYHHKYHCIDYIKLWESDSVRYLKSREVKYLVHFTPISNLPSILEHGIVPRMSNAKTTDDLRLDSHTDASSFSISFPNYKMFYKKRKQLSTDFVVLLIDIDVLSHIPPERVAFYDKNAACTESIRSQFSDHCSPNALRSMFSSEQIRKQNHLPSYYTTDPQAEIMIKDIVQPRFIQSVIVENVFVPSYKQALSICQNHNSIIVNPDSMGIFKWPSDWDNWQKEKNTSFQSSPTVFPINNDYSIDDDELPF